MTGLAYTMWAGLEEEEEEEEEEGLFKADAVDHDLQAGALLE